MNNDKEKPKKKRRRRKRFRQVADPARTKRYQLKESEWDEWKKIKRPGRRPALTDEDKVNIVEAMMRGAPAGYCAKKYQVSISVVYRIDKKEVMKDPRLVALAEYLEQKNKEPVNK